MPSFLLRDLDPLFWSRVQAKAKAEGVTVKALILRLLAVWLGVIAVSLLAAGCAYHNPTAPSSTTSAAVNLTPASIRLNVASRADHQLDVIAEVTSADGHPVPAIALDFAIADGTVTPSAMVTDATGFARTVAALSSATTVSVNGAGLSTSLHVDGTSVPTPPAALSVSINASGATAGTPSTFGLATSMTIARADWTFGDAATASTSTGSTTHVYGRSGVYPVTVTVTDAAGHTASADASVTVAAAPPPPLAPPPPVAPPAAVIPPPALAATLACTTPTTPPLSAVCNVAATWGGTNVASSAITGVDWDWGDGTVVPSEVHTTVPFHTHAYPQSGTYLIVATVTATVTGVSPSPQATTTKIVTVP